MACPDWWEWEIDGSNSHLAKRMRDRRFSEVDLRAMLSNAKSIRPGTISGRWIVETLWENVAWAIVVEPDDSKRSLIVVTAYPSE